MKGKYPAHFCNGIWGFYYDFVPWIYFFHYNMQLATIPLEAAGHPNCLETYYNFRISQLPQAQHFARKIKGTSGAFYTRRLRQPRKNGYRNGPELHLRRADSAFAL